MSNRSFICKDVEELVDHMLLHCTKTTILWQLIFSLFIGGFSDALYGKRNTFELAWSIHGKETEKNLKSQSLAIVLDIMEKKQWKVI